MQPLDLGIIPGNPLLIQGLIEEYCEPCTILALNQVCTQTKDLVQEDNYWRKECEKKQFVDLNQEKISWKVHYISQEVAKIKENYGFEAGKILRKVFPYVGLVGELASLCTVPFTFDAINTKYLGHERKFLDIGILLTSGIITDLVASLGINDITWVYPKQQLFLINLLLAILGSISSANLFFPNQQLEAFILDPLNPEFKDILDLHLTMGGFILMQSAILHTFIYSINKLKNNLGTVKCERTLGDWTFKAYVTSKSLCNRVLEISANACDQSRKLYNDAYELGSNILSAPRIILSFANKRTFF